MKSDYKFVIYILLGFCLWLIVDKSLDTYTRHGDVIYVPSLAGVSIDADTLNTYDLEFIIIDSAAYNPNYERGAILSHAPKAGAIVKPGRKIYLTINPFTIHYIPFPNLKNKSLRQAITLLENNAFRIGDLYYVDHFARDVIRSTQLNFISYSNDLTFLSSSKANTSSIVQSGDSLAKFSIIDLYLGNGYVDDVPVPNLLGLEFDQVKRKLNNNSLNLGNYFIGDSVLDTLTAVIYKQEPDFNDNIEIGSFISVWAKDTLID